MSCSKAKSTWTASALILMSACGRVGVELLPVGVSVTPADAGDVFDAGLEPDGAIDRDAAADGEAQTDSDAGATCPTECQNAHGSADCSAGQCLLSCSIGYADCDGRADNGCETSTAETVLSCGECGVSCSNPNGTTLCAEGVCAPVCSAGTADCDSDPQNGCEADLNGTEHCGSCGRACSNPHGTTACASGGCTPTCAADYRSCDGDLANGCETSIAQDPMNCGGCGTRCDTSYQACIDGSCQVSMCPQGRGDCDANRGDCETDTTSTVGHCGFCGNACTVANGTASCANGTCQVASCNGGFANCDNVPATGCEVPLATSTAHCGRCANACTNAHGATSCVGGSCVPSCSSGWGSCDANAQNGCETQLNSVSHCGACGRVCPNDVPNATPACNAGVCTSVCNNLSGVYALKLTVPTTWPSGQYVQSGSGTFEFWGRMVLTHSGTSLSGSVTSCGRTVPDFRNSVVNELYGVTFPSSLFDRALPTTPISGTLPSASPTASFSLQPSAMYMGLTLTDPINGAWPSLSQVSAADHDGDGFRGVAIDYRTGGGYSAVPTAGTLFAARANRGYIAERVRFSLSGTLTSCTASSGAATVPDIESHTVGCRLTSGSQCSSSQYGHLDANTPGYQTRPSTYALIKLAEPSGTVTCSQVRAALP